jgi:hypothetical protein
LINLTRATLTYADQTATRLSHLPDPIMVAIWQAEFHHYRPLIAVHRGWFPPVGSTIC